MKLLALIAAVAVVVSATPQDCGSPAACEAECQAWLDVTYESEMRQLAETAVQSDWIYNTYISDEHAADANAGFEAIAAYDQTAWNDFVTQYDQSTFSDADTIRRMDLMSVLGNAALPEEDLQQFNIIVSNMTAIYGSAKVCPFDNQSCDLATEGLTLEPDIESILADSANHSWEELEYLWQAWRDVSGKLMRDQFIEYINLNNQAAVANNLPDASELWLIPYTMDVDDGDDFRADLEELWTTMRPLYEKVHAWLRYNYRSFWGASYTMAEDEPIPAHISGNMWAQTWHLTYDIVAPYPEVDNPLSGVDDELINQGYTVPDIFQLSNDFYTSMGLADMQMCYDTPCVTENTQANQDCIQDNPMIEKPDWDVVCHASAWDMYHASLDDYRIKMCAEVNLEDLVTIHHEMGHIQYFIQYEDKPLQFRDGANPGFHEAIGDTMALSVQTPIHLNSIGLLPEIPTDSESDINFLLSQAMERVMFLPFAYTIDQYRWALFNGTFAPEEMTYRWWELRERYQGINPPVMRSEEDFDAGAKYHVAANVPYIRYFVAHILEYQFYKQMCLDSQQYDPQDPLKPLHKCDFSQGPFSILAGERLKDMLAAGSSLPWPDILEGMTGSRKMDASAVLEYFAPLESFLDDQIATNGIPVGWKSTFSDYIN